LYTVERFVDSSILVLWSNFSAGDKNSTIQSTGWYNKKLRVMTFHRLKLGSNVIQL